MFPKIISINIHSNSSKERPQSDIAEFVQAKTMAEKEFSLRGSKYEETHEEAKGNSTSTHIYIKDHFLTMYKQYISAKGGSDETF